MLLPDVCHQAKWYQAPPRGARGASAPLTPLPRATAVAFRAGRKFALTNLDVLGYLPSIPVCVCDR